MSRQRPRYSQAPFRDTTDESAPPRYSTSPHPLRGRHHDAPSTEGVAQANFPSHLSSRDTQGLPHLPPITSTTSHTARSHGGTNTADRVSLPPLREAIPVRSRSDSPITTGTDYNARHYHDVAHLYLLEGFQDVRGSTSITSRVGDREPPQTYRLAPVRGGDVSNIARPSSAHDSAYLSDLSTSSARGGPPPSHTSTESTASASSEMSLRRVKNWRRAQHTSPGEGQQNVGAGSGLLRDEHEFEVEVEAGGEAGRYAPSYAEIEYERPHVRRAQYPVSTMRGGSVSSRVHSSYAYGSPPAAPASPSDPLRRINPYPEAPSLVPGPVSGLAQVSDPPPSQRNLAARIGKAKVEVPGPTRMAAEAATGEGSAIPAEVDELQESSDDEGPLRFAAVSSTPSRAGSAGGTRTPRTKIEVACRFFFFLLSHLILFLERKMKCDGLRPTCKNCERKRVQCSYIPVVRRRGPGKKKKATDSRPKKTSKKTEAERDVKQSKGKARETSSDVGALELDTTELSQEASSSSGLRFEHHPPFPPPHPPGMFSSEPDIGPPPGSELYLPPPFPEMQSSPRGQSSRPSLSPFPTHSLLPLPPPYNPHEQFPPPPPLGHRPSPPFGVGGGNLFLPPGHSPSMGAGREMHDIVDPYAGVNVNVYIPPPPDSAGSSSMVSDVGGPPIPWPLPPHHHQQQQPSSQYPPIHGSARTTGMISSSSEGELSRGRHARRRRPSKRAKTNLDDEEDEDEGVYGLEEERVRPSSGGRELEEGEIDEAGPSSRPVRKKEIKK